MSEWWTYQLQDFLLFSADTYYRLIELCHRALWPLQIVMLLVGVAAVVSVAKFRSVASSRMIGSVFAAIWLWVAWDFFLKRYATINWAATWFAAAFMVEALLLLVVAMGGGFRRSGRVHVTQWLGLAMCVFALFGQPLVGHLLGRPFTQLELFGITPDPTALATLGLVLFMASKSRVLLMTVPLIWCAVSGATLHAMGAPEALLMPIGGVVAVGAALWRRSIE